MSKYLSFFLFSLLLILFLLGNIHEKISTSLISVLPNSENKELLEHFFTQESNKKIFLAVKGDSQKSLGILKELEKKFLEIQGIEKEKFQHNTNLKEYEKKYQLYFQSINGKKLHSLDVKSELEKLYQEMMESFFVGIIDQEDPFSLFSKKTQSIDLKNGKLFLKEYGYLSIFSLKSDINSLKQYEKLYNQIKEIEKHYQDTISFSPIYYFVENSRYIKKDATKIGTIAIVVLLLLYLLVLKNGKLLLNTLLTLGSSAIFATIVVASFYGEISVFVLVFGISISTIAIDYMFHHYFHGLYERKKSLNKEVFLGFMTTFGVFFLFFLSDFILIQQITLFAMLSLLFSYIVFSFVFPRITFVQKEFSFELKTLPWIDTKILFLLSFIVIGVSSLNLRFDFDMNALNYDNKALKEKEVFFHSKLFLSEKYTVILQAKSIEKLLEYNETIRTIDPTLQSPLNNFMTQAFFEQRKNELLELGLDEIYLKLQKEAKVLGFKKEIFQNTYQYERNFFELSDKKIDEFGLNIDKYKGGYITFLQVSKEKYEQILHYDFIHSVSVKKLFEISLQKEFQKLMILGIGSICFIFLVIFLVAKKELLKAWIFLVFPSALIFVYFYFVPINILHLFMFFIILAICIDYGIYSVTNNNQKTKKAIFFSALSSFAGFGVLIFSTTNSLSSIGSVATLGIIGVLILVFLRKDDAAKSL